LSIDWEQDMKLGISVLLCFIIVGVASAQKLDHVAPAAISQPEGPTVTFVLPGTTLSVIYPKDFRVEDRPGVAHRNYRAMFGDPESTGPNQCFPVLITLGTGDPEIHTQDPNAAHWVPDPPSGGVVVQEIKANCLDKNEPAADRLIDLVTGPGHMEGHHLLASGVNYKLGKNEICFAATFAFSADVDGIRRASSGQTYLANASTNYHGRIFLWTFAANDREVLNRLLKVWVQFDKDHPWPLVPFSIVPDDGKGNEGTVPLPQ
jgi:hypothetical protein